MVFSQNAITFGGDALDVEAKQIAGVQNSRLIVSSYLDQMVVGVIHVKSWPWTSRTNFVSRSGIVAH